MVKKDFSEFIQKFSDKEEMLDFIHEFANENGVVPNNPNTNILISLKLLTEYYNWLFEDEN